MPKVNSINVLVPLVPSYNSSYCVLNSTQVNLHIPLTAGEHTITTPPMDVGKLNGKPDSVIQARITLWYKYNPNENIVVLCSEKMVSKDSMFLTTSLKGNAETSVQYIHDQDADPCRKNTDWNYCTSSSPDLKVLLHHTIKRAHALILEAVKRLKLKLLQLSPLPPGIGDDFKVVYYKGKFLELYDPRRTYSKDHVIIPILSAYKGPAYFPPDQPFANVSGSTNDPKPRLSMDSDARFPSWMALWRAVFGEETFHCSSLNIAEFQCRGKTLGGHVFCGVQHGREYAEFPHGYDYIFIIPICNAHNSNYNVLMYPSANQLAVGLKNYFGRD